VAMVWLVRAGGVAAVTPAALVLGTLVALAGALLVVFPAMDHPWLDAIERAAPAFQDAFLTRTERAVRRDSADTIRRGEDELRRLRALQQDVAWGTRTLGEGERDRLRQFLAGRAEINAGDRLVLGTLRAHARARQRYWVGLPLAILGVIGALALLRRRARNDT